MSTYMYTAKRKRKVSNYSIIMIATSLITGVNNSNEPRPPGSTCTHLACSMESEAHVPSSGNSPLPSHPASEGAAPPTTQAPASGEGRDGSGNVAADDPLDDLEEEPKSKPGSGPPGEDSSDPELEELLDCE